MKKQIKVGDIVLIEDVLTPRLLWKIGIVKEIFKSADGHVRSAIIRSITDHGKVTEYRRAIKQLYPLESMEDPA